MFVIMGGTGHVGSATAASLRSRGHAVAVVTRNAALAKDSLSTGMTPIQADLHDVESLRRAFKYGQRAFVLNPPANVASNTDEVEHETIAKILIALNGSGLEKIVAASTGAAQPGTRIGDLGTLWSLEQGLKQQSIPVAINRAAYYMSNWDTMYKNVKESGKLVSMFPADLVIPMVDPIDVGLAAAERLLTGTEDVGIQYIEGPARYTPSDVANAFGDAIGRNVDVETIPRNRWKQEFLETGFSNEAADSYVGMLSKCLDHGFDIPADSRKGRTTLQSYIRKLVMGR